MGNYGRLRNRARPIAVLLTAALVILPAGSRAARKAPPEVGAELSATKYSLTLNIMKMQLHLNQLFKLRVVDIATGAPVGEEIIESISTADFIVTLNGVLEAGKSYNIDFFADHNLNQLYDPPPEDHAWRLTVKNVSGPVTLDWAHPGDLGDIAYPNPGEKGNANQGSGGADPEETPVVCTCDFNGDSRVNISDVIKWLLEYRSGVVNQCLDLDGDGTVMISDALTLLFRMRNGTCAAPSPAGLAAAIYPISGGSEGLTKDQVEYIENISELLSLTPRELEALRLALHGTAGGSTLPKAYTLGPNRPNPFNPATSISYSVPEGSVNRVSLKVYDLRGRVVRSLAEGLREPGTYSVFWNGENEAGGRVSSGVYFYRLTAGEFSATRKMVLLK